MFAKIFAQIFDSSIAEDHMVRHVFMDLLVLADRDGVVDMTAQAIARRTNVPEELVNHAIKVLMTPDGSSRSPLEQGARLILLDSHRDWGWQIVNYEHYREIRDEESRKAYFRDYKREYRHRKSNKSTSGPQVSTVVLDSPTMSTKAEVDTEADVDTKKTKALARSVPPEQLAGTLPLVNGSDYRISKIQISQWSQAYPGINVTGELRKMKAWLDANPKKKKTSSGIARAINNWLNRAQDKIPMGGTNGNGHKKSNFDILRESLAADQNSLDGSGDSEGWDANQGKPRLVFEASVSGKPQ